MSNKEDRKPMRDFPRVSAIFLIGFSAIIIVARLYTYNEPLERDLTNHALIAQGLLEGRSLYSDLWNHKPPGIYITYAVAVAFAGITPLAIFILNIAATLTCLMGVYVAGSSGMNGYRGGILAALVWTIVSGDPMLQANQPNTEVFINACLIWAFAILVKESRAPFDIGRSLIVGILFAIASLYKTIAVVPAVLLGLGHIALPPDTVTRQRALLHVTAMACAGILIWLLIFGYFATTGRAHDFIEANFTYNLFYLLDNFNEAIKRDYRTLVSSFLIVLLFFVFMTKIVVHYRTLRRSFLMLLLFAASTHIAIALPGKYYPHYYQLWLPIVSVCLGWLFSSMLIVPNSLLKRISLAAVIAVICSLLYLEIRNFKYSPDEWSQKKYGDIFIVTKHVGTEISEILKDDETFYMWGMESGLYFYSGRRPPTGVLWDAHVMWGPLKEKLTNRVLSDLMNMKPELIITYPSFNRNHKIPAYFLMYYEEIPDNYFRKFRGKFNFYARNDGHLMKRLKNNSASRKP